MVVEFIPGLDVLSLNIPHSTALDVSISASDSILSLSSRLSNDPLAFLSSSPSATSTGPASISNQSRVVEGTTFIVPPASIPN